MTQVIFDPNLRTMSVSPSGTCGVASVSNTRWVCLAYSTERKDRVPSAYLYTVDVGRAGSNDGIALAYHGFTTLRIRISLPSGTANRLGKKSVVIKKVAILPSSVPPCSYSCMNTIPSSRVLSLYAPVPFFPVMNFVTKARMDLGEVRSHSSAKTFGFSVVVWMSGMSV